MRNSYLHSIETLKRFQKMMQQAVNKYRNYTDSFARINSVLEDRNTYRKKF